MSQGFDMDGFRRVAQEISVLAAAQPDLPDPAPEFDVSTEMREAIVSAGFYLADIEMSSLTVRVVKAMSMPPSPSLGPGAMAPLGPRVYVNPDVPYGRARLKARPSPETGVSIKET